MTVRIIVLALIDETRATLLLEHILVGGESAFRCGERPLDGGEIRLQRCGRRLPGCGGTHLIKSALSQLVVQRLLLRFGSRGLRLAVRNLLLELGDARILDSGTATTTWRLKSARSSREQFLQFLLGCFLMPEIEHRAPRTRGFVGNRLPELRDDAEMLLQFLRARLDGLQQRALCDLSCLARLT